MGNLARDICRDDKTATLHPRNKLSSNVSAPFYIRDEQALGKTLFNYDFSYADLIILILFGR